LPYVALYFAMSTPHETDQGSARIYAVDIARWPIRTLDQPNLDSCFPYVELLAPDPAFNPRSVNQDALVMATNVVRPEWFIANFTPVMGTKPTFVVIDIPWALRRTLLTELGRMGIGPRSVYGGTDGACLELLERYSDPGWDSL
jgi:hypothetical protein